MLLFALETFDETSDEGNRRLTGRNFLAIIIKTPAARNVEKN